MRVLLVNELRMGGGTEVQSLRERDLLRSKGHVVMYLTFDPKLPQELSGLDPNIPLSFVGASLLYHRVMVSKSIKRSITAAIERFHPDIVHLNNVTAAAATVYRCLEQYPCFQTIRDYSVVCPKGTCVRDDYSACRGYKHNSCYLCIGNHIKYMIKNICLPILNWRRTQAVDRYICPSSALSTCCIENGINAQTVNNPFDFSVVSKEAPCFSKTFLFYGAISEQKGVAALLEAWTIFSSEAPDAHLLLVGRVVEDFESTFKKLLGKTPNAEHIGSMSNSEIMELYKSVYCVIVPSLWMENYPNTVLEALANKTLVIGSDRGGIPELIQSEEFLFDVRDIHAIVHALKSAYEMKISDYVETTELAYRRCKEQNSLETYYDRIIALCGEILDDQGGVVE